MSAETLRRAAALMRDRAEHSAVAIVGPLTWTTHFDGADSMTRLHYQTMTPAVGLAVAALLDEAADFVASNPNHKHGYADSELAIARAYLGEQP